MDPTIADLPRNLHVVVSSTLLPSTRSATQKRAGAGDYARKSVRRLALQDLEARDSASRRLRCLWQQLCLCWQELVNVHAVLRLMAETALAEQVTADLGGKLLVVTCAGSGFGDRAGDAHAHQLSLHLTLHPLLSRIVSLLLHWQHRHLRQAAKEGRPAAH